MALETALALESNVEKRLVLLQDYTNILRVSWPMERTLMLIELYNRPLMPLTG